MEIDDSIDEPVIRTSGLTTWIILLMVDIVMNSRLIIRWSIIYSQCEYLFWLKTLFIDW